MRLAIAIVVGNLMLTAIGLHFTFQAYCEEKEHAEFLFDCTHMQRPDVCENQWLAYEAQR
jgi:hypothetical protein